MKIFTAAQTKTIDAYTIVNEPIASIDLMERAVLACYEWLTCRYNLKNNIYIFTGSGNNGGDGLAIARLMANQGYNVEVFLVKYSELSLDTQINFERLKNQGKARINILENINNIPKINTDCVIVDALFGSGLSRPLIGLPAQVIDHLNQCQGHKIAIDIPSGLFGEENSNLNAGMAFKAEHTLTFQYPFLSFFFSKTSEYIGKWHILPIGLHQKILDELATPYHLIERSDILLKSRKAYDHKGTFGHALVLAGKYGMAGAAILASKACLRSGCGMITAHVPKKIYSILQTNFPEAIASIDENETCLSSLPDLSKYQAIAVGPGIGQEKPTIDMLRSLFDKWRGPMVIDADGLNILSNHTDWLKWIPKNTILTPHAAEFRRLAGKSTDSFDELNKLQHLAVSIHCVVILKGAYTKIASPDGCIYINQTGNNGMATAGSGDVLTGIIVSLLAQGYQPIEAAKTGVFVHGLAGDLALNIKSHESLIATDIIENIGLAFKELQKKCLTDQVDRL